MLWKVLGSSGNNNTSGSVYNRKKEKVNMGLDMLLSRNIRWCNIRIVAGIAILCLFLLSGNAGASPPPAILSIDGNEQTSGIGTNCWKVENETFSLCADYAGIITPAEPLITRSPFTAILHLPLQVPPEELGFSATRVTDDDELNKAYGFLVKVYDPAAEVTTQAATATESEKSTTSSPNETHNIIPTEKAAGFQFALAITILLAVYASGRKRR
ncbi:MAG: hypothetical protein O8C62_06155 [Candidatus Methanoperedens sp.]|nr:hypothetical protein [Candidatus Methanoperedens sp.]